VVRIDEHRALSEKEDWAFFDDSLSMPTDVRREIRPLRSAAARSLWTTYVSEDPLQRHPMLLPAGHWLRRQQEGPNWLPDFEHDNLVQPGSGVATFLEAALALDPHRPVYFIYSRELAYVVPVSVFLDQWRAFLLLDDEGPFLFDSVSGTYASFGPNGRLFIGRKGN
jgi:hypothetical protein